MGKQWNSDRFYFLGLQNHCKWWLQPLNKKMLAPWKESFDKPNVIIAQSCPTLCDSMDCSPPGFSVHGILQARILEWVVMPFSRGSSWPRNRSRVSHIAGRFFTSDKHSVLKSWDITLLTKVCIVKAMVFPVIMYGCESWTIKKTECQKTDAFELCCLRRLLRVPCTVRRSN